MKRIHYSDAETLCLEKKYLQGIYKLKPCGLWYSINNEWLKWCKSEMPSWITKFKFELNINTSNILIISNISELQSFCSEYKYKLNPFKSLDYIEWARVSKNYDGIEIRNYDNLKYDRNLDYKNVWVYGWDISSGCIWNLQALKNYNKL